MFLRRALLAPSVASWLLVSAPCAAQTPPAANSQADELTRQGNELAKRHQWAEAAARLRQAWALKHAYDIAGNLGIAELQSGAYRDAAEHLSYASRTFPANGKAEHRALVAESLTKARNEVGAVKVTVNPAGARVFVDGRDVGAAPLEDDVFVDPGAHVIEAKLAGYVTASRSLTVAKGSSARADLVLSPDASEARPSPPTVGDGRPSVPPTPASGSSLKGGLLIATGALAVAGLGVGLTFTVLANGKGGDADTKLTQIRMATGKSSPCPSAAGCDAVLGSLRDRDRFQGVAALGYVAGGVGALGMLVVALVPWPAQAARSGLQVAPAVGVRAGGLTVGGKF